jgi:hypothetical protein
MVIQFNERISSAAVDLPENGACNYGNHFHSGDCRSALDVQVYWKAKTGN